MRRKASPSTLPVTLILAAGLGVAAALWTWTRPADPMIFPARAESVEVHLINNGFHTDLALPRAAVEAHGGPVALAAAALPPGDWILVGWGDARFYVDQSPMEGRLLDGARAFFAPGNASVVMLNPYQGDPRLAFSDARRRTFRLSPEGLSRLLDRLEGSLELADGRARIATTRPGDDARFYASRETFWIGWLCNNWTADLLNHAGLAVRPMRAATAGEVVAIVDRAEAARAEADRAEVDRPGQRS